MMYLLTTNSKQGIVTIGITNCIIKAEKLKQEYLIKLEEKYNKAYDLPDDEFSDLLEEVTEISFELLSEKQKWFYHWLYDFEKKEYSEEVNIQELKEDLILLDILND